MKHVGEAVDENIKNFLYRIHFPCRRKGCNCDKKIEDAIKYLKENVATTNPT